MATVTVKEIVVKCQTILQDTTSTRWPAEELVGWLNDAYREIVSYDPYAYTETGIFHCAPGTKQELNKSRDPEGSGVPAGGKGGFPNAKQFLRVTRNCPYDLQAVEYGTGRTVRYIDRRILDDQRPDWHKETPVDEVQHYIHDEKQAFVFYVYPPATENTGLEILFASIPEGHETEGGYLAETGAGQTTIKLTDSYANVILDYMLYRAYSKDADYAANAQRAANHFQAVQLALGAKQMTRAEQVPPDEASELRTMRRQQQP